MTIPKRFLARTLALTVGACATAGMISTDASACGGGWYEPIIEIDHRPYGLTIAERHIDRGEYQAAAGVIIRMIPHIKQLKPTSSDIIERAHRVLAVATARSGGELDVGLEVPAHVQGSWLGKTAEDRTANLDWSIASLRTLSEDAEDDPALGTELAEALAQVDEHRDEAKTILEKLAKKDLVASPHGYATLASLRAETGDSKGQKVALKRCEAMAVDAATCGTNAAKS